MLAFTRPPIVFKLNTALKSRTRVKICGITRAEDAVVTARLGVDAIGLVFYAKSPLNVMMDQAKAISDGLPGFGNPAAAELSLDNALCRKFADDNDFILMDLMRDDFKRPEALECLVQSFNDGVAGNIV